MLENAAIYGKELDENAGEESTSGNAPEDGDSSIWCYLAN